jgi:hypothetical protein
MKILVWKHKYGTAYYEASSKRKLSYALFRMVKSMIDMGYVAQIEEDEQPVPNLYEQWNSDVFKVKNAKPVMIRYALASAKRLADGVRGNEYCDWDIEPVENPI